METYEKHEFPKGMLDRPKSATPKGVAEPDPLRELAALTDLVDNQQRTEIEIAKVESNERIREREKLRPIDETAVRKPT